MDNARFHKNKRIQKLLNRHVHRILCLPPYSPNLNPIEKKWAQANFLRQVWMDNNLPKLFHDMGCIDFIKTQLWSFENKTIISVKGDTSINFLACYSPERLLKFHPSIVVTLLN